MTVADPALTLPTFREIDGAAFTTVDAFLRFQRHAAATARVQVFAHGVRAWSELSSERRERFRSALGDVATDVPTEDMWCRAWWINALGASPRAPFEIATPSTLADTLMLALGACLAEVPTAPRQTFDRWWEQIQRDSRSHIAHYVAERVAASRQRASLATDSVAVTPVRNAIDRRHDRSAWVNRVSTADRRRQGHAQANAVAIHRLLDEQFAPLESVCGRCTRETGGCCSLTVPLLWREPDFKLIALGDETLPNQSELTPGSCPFLGPIGCQLPSERRPHICRTFLCEDARTAIADRMPTVESLFGRLTDARSRLGI